MTIDATNFFEALEEFKSIEKEYLEKFGEDSLEFVDLWDPLHIEQYPGEVREGTELLKKCITNDNPLENIPRVGEVIY